MRLIYIFLVFFTINSYSLTLDSIVCKFSFSNIMGVKKVSINSYKLNQTVVSGFTSNNSIQFNLDSSFEPGVYFLICDGRTLFDFIVDGKEREIDFSIKTFRKEDLPVVLKSNQNKIWYDYLLKTKPLIKDLDKLTNLLASYPTQPVYNKVKSIYSKRRKQYYKMFDSFVNDYQNSLAGLLVANFPYYYSNLNQEPTLKDFLRMDFYWEGIDTSNPILLNSPIYINHIDNYLNLIETVYQEPLNFSKNSQEPLQKSIKVIIDKFSGSEMTKQFALLHISKYLTKKNILDLNSFNYN